MTDGEELFTEEEMQKEYARGIKDGWKQAEARWMDLAVMRFRDGRIEEADLLRRLVGVMGQPKT